MGNGQRLATTFSLDGFDPDAAVDTYVKRVEHETQVFLDRLAAAGHDLALETEVFIAQAAAHRRLTRRFLEGQRLLLRAAASTAMDDTGSGQNSDVAPAEVGDGAMTPLANSLAIGRWDQAEADLQHLLDRWWAMERSASESVADAVTVEVPILDEDRESALLTVEQVLDGARLDDLRALCVRLLTVLQASTMASSTPSDTADITADMPADMVIVELPTADVGDDPFSRFWARPEASTPRRRRRILPPAIVTGFLFTFGLSVALAWVG